MVWCIICILGGLIAASLDARPDPPAVYPHAAHARTAVTAQAGGGGDACRLPCERTNSEAWALGLPPMRRLASVANWEPKLPDELRELTRYAADTSPPCAIPFTS
jgi:hypothetical protein